MPGGRPTNYQNPEELQRLVDDYFDTENQPTLAGLAVHLGLSRKTLYNYAERDEFLHIIKKAREKVEALYEKRAIYGDKQVTGVIFALKNMGWSDRQDITSGEEKIQGPVILPQEKIPGAE